MVHSSEMGARRRDGERRWQPHRDTSTIVDESHCDLGLTTFVTIHSSFYFED